MTVMFAVEFNHSIAQVVERRQSIIQVRIVILIAILAVMRKFIVLDFENTSAEKLISLALVVVALAGIYWVFRSSELRRTETTRHSGTTPEK